MTQPRVSFYSLALLLTLTFALTSPALAKHYAQDDDEDWQYKKQHQQVQQNSQPIPVPRGRPTPQIQPIPEIQPTPQKQRDTRHHEHYERSEQEQPQVFVKHKMRPDGRLSSMDVQFEQAVPPNAQPTEYRVIVQQFPHHFTEKRRAAFSDYVHRRYGRFCPPGLFAFRSGCLPPPKTSAFYEIGGHFEGDYDAPPPYLVQLMGPPPYGTFYAMVGNDLLLVTSSNHMILETLTLASLFF